MSLASLYCEIFIGLKNSSSRISPGCMGRKCRFAIVCTSTVIIRYLNIVCIAIAPDKADAPLVINSDAVLSAAVTFEFLQSPCRSQANG